MTYKNPNYFGVHIKDSAKANEMQANSCFLLSFRIELTNLCVQIKPLLVVPVSVEIPFVSEPVPIPHKSPPFALFKLVELGNYIPE